MKMSKTFRAGLVLAALAVGASAQAASIGFNPDPASAVQGQTFSVTLVGRGFTDGVDGTYGGGVSVAWNPAILSLVSYDTSVFGGDKLLADSNTTTVIDNAGGKLDNLSVSSFFDGVTTADFDIATLTFQALGAGVSQLSTAIGLFNNGQQNIWTDASFDAAIQVNPQFGTGSVAVAPVPLPAAGWLLLSGLAGLAGAARRRRAAA